MIDRLPVNAVVPLDYRYALDAAMTVLVPAGTPAVVCNIDELDAEVRKRLPLWSEAHLASAALWVEPLSSTWQMDLAVLAQRLSPGSPLVIVASRPLARILPERRTWSEQPLGLQIGGISWLRGLLPQADFVVEATYGIHSLLSIALSQLSYQFERRVYPHIGDRLHFAARLHYRTTGPLAVFSTVALLIARKVQTK